MALKRPSVSLDDILNENAGDVTLDGVSHVVRSVPAPDYQRLMAMDATNPDIDYLMDVAGRIVPTLTPAQVARLNLRALAEIARIGLTMAIQVEEELPNSSGPASETPTPAETSASPQP